METMVGKTVWVFDANRRVYAKGPDGRSTGGPIFREYFRETTITGETSRSWIVGSGYGAIKVPKNGGPVHGSVYMTRQAVDDAIWLDEHRYKLMQAAGRVRDVETLRKVAVLIGYDDTKGAE